MVPNFDFSKIKGKLDQSSAIAEVTIQVIFIVAGSVIVGLIILLFITVICKVLVKQFQWARNVPMLRRLFLDEEDEA